MNLRHQSQLFYKLKLANQEMTTRFEKETGFSITRYELLLFLKEKGQCSQGELQQVLKIDSAAITRHLKILEAKGYVIRERNKLNNREIFITLTEHSKKALERCEHKYNSSEDKLNLGLTVQEEMVLLELLTKLLGEKRIK